MGRGALGMRGCLCHLFPSLIFVNCAAYRESWWKDLLQFFLPFVLCSLVCKRLPPQPAWTPWLSWVLKASEKHLNLLFSVSLCDKVAQIDANNSLQVPQIALLGSAHSTRLGTGQQLWFRNESCYFQIMVGWEELPTIKSPLPTHWARRLQSEMVKVWAS